MTQASLRDGSAQDPFDLYEDWRADEELSASRRSAMRWAAAAATALLVLSGYSFLQALSAG